MTYDIATGENCVSCLYSFDCSRGDTTLGGECKVCPKLGYKFECLECYGGNYDLLI